MHPMYVAVAMKLQACMDIITNLYFYNFYNMVMTFQFLVSLSRHLISSIHNDIVILPNPNSHDIIPMWVYF